MPVDSPADQADSRQITACKLQHEFVKHVIKWLKNGLVRLDL
jgi:hypothetical protein